MFIVHLKYIGQGKALEQPIRQEIDRLYELMQRIKFLKLQDKNRILMCDNKIEQFGEKNTTMLKLFQNICFGGNSHSFHIQQYNEVISNHFHKRFFHNDCYHHLNRSIQQSAAMPQERIQVLSPMDVALVFFIQKYNYMYVLIILLQLQCYKNDLDSRKNFCEEGQSFCKRYRECDGGNS
jgi:hypothetical protein